MALEPTTPQVIEMSFMGEILEITLPRASNRFTHNLSYRYVNAVGTIATGVTTSCNWLIPIELAYQVTNGAIGAYCVITCTTYDGSLFIGTRTVSVQINVPADAKAVINSVSIEATPLTSDTITVFGGYVQNHTAFHITVDAEAQYGATISKYETNIDGKKYTGNDITTDLISSSGQVPVSIVVTDSRSKVTMYNTEIAILPYSLPTIHSLRAERCLADGTLNDNGTYLKAIFSFNVDPKNKLRYVNYALSYKLDGGTMYVDLMSNSAHSFDGSYVSESAILNADNAYSLLLDVMDYFGEVIAEVPVSTGFSLIDFYSSGKGIAFGETAENDGISVNLDAEFKKAVNFKTEPRIDGVKLSDYIKNQIEKYMA